MLRFKTGVEGAVEVAEGHAERDAPRSKESVTPSISPVGSVSVSGTSRSLSWSTTFLSS